MRLRRLILPILALTLLACQAVTGLFPTPPLPSAPPVPLMETAQVEPPVEPTSTITATQPSASPTPAAAPTLSVTPSALPVQTETISDPEAPVFQLRLHPDGELFVGDQVSFEVVAPPGADTAELDALLSLTGSAEIQLGSAPFESYGIAGRDQATLYWVWDTADLQPGEYDLVYSIQPTGLTFTETITLHPASLLLPWEPDAQWASTTSQCCILHYITGTAAERDLEALVAMTDEQSARASRALGAEFEQPVPIVLLPRILGHGGFTSQEISVSYLDRNYAGSSPQIVLHHELVHVLDSRLGGDLRPTLLLEGIAVYLSGGHFKPEPLLPRAAALQEMGWYIPLAELADDFYPAQHEIGYLQAGALVSFMVETWGWEAFSDFYRHIAPAPNGGSQSQAIDVALREHFGIGFAELEEGFIQALHAETIAERHRQDVRLSVKLYDLVRSYQVALDPSAHFMTAWLPDGVQMRERGIVADYLRHPDTPENIALEVLMAAAETYLQEGDYPKAEQHLDAVQLALDTGLQDAGSLDPLLADSLAVVRLLLARGYQAQRVVLEDDKARAWSTSLGAAPGLELVMFDLLRTQPGNSEHDQEGWSITAQLGY